MKKFLLIFSLVLFSNSSWGGCDGNTCTSAQPETVLPGQSFDPGLAGLDFSQNPRGNSVPNLGGGNFESFDQGIFNSQGARVHRCGQFLCVAGNLIFIGDAGEISVRDSRTNRLLKADALVSQQVLNIYQDWSRRVQSGECQNDARFAIAKRALNGNQFAGNSGFRGLLDNGSQGINPGLGSNTNPPISPQPIDPSTSSGQPPRGSEVQPPSIHNGESSGSENNPQHPIETRPNDDNPSEIFKTRLQKFSEGTSPLAKIIELTQDRNEPNPQGTEVKIQVVSAACENKKRETFEKAAVIKKEEDAISVWLTDSPSSTKVPLNPASSFSMILTGNKLSGTRLDSGSEKIELATVKEGEVEKLWIHYKSNTDEYICHEAPVKKNE